MAQAQADSDAANELASKQSASPTRQRVTQRRWDHVKRRLDLGE